MKTNSRAFALVSWSILMLGLSGQGCSPEDPCAGKGPFDAYVDWKGDVTFCTGVGTGSESPTPPSPPTPPTPPPPPDVSKYQPPDPPGPKDPEAVIRTAIFAQSCGLAMYDQKGQTINHVPPLAYYVHDRDPASQSYLDRTGCFKDKANACDAVRECWGHAYRYRDLTLEPYPGGYTQACESGVMHLIYGSTASNPNTLESWKNCRARGLECYDDDGIYCEAARTPCEPNRTDDPPCTTDDRPFGCEPIGPDGWYFEKRVCSDFGLTCNQNSWPRFPDCVGTGAACELPSKWWYYDWYTYDYRIGAIACESETTLRSCVGTAEQLIDCGSLGLGFKCIPGETPYCGLASECNADTPITCDGDSIVVCNAGKIQKVDCKSLGFETCDLDVLGCAPNTFVKPKKAQ